ncbi:endonuclease I family protein [Acanthopleuribacter pedis]|uniref:Endonuclease n=1 Tax=Acanthopleuribacter pedis TaxID=442870 RepID=A0A8J7Q364_9BACT|nr:endonuclease [Acanthopleuribacter pedis]MBO1319687.1 endonuclease [Acanthopleuribacter pedis]
MFPGSEGVTRSFFPVRRAALVSARLVLACLVLTAFSPLFGQRINEFVNNHTGNDIYEFVEIFGEPNTDYSHLTIVQIEADTDSGGLGAGWIDTVHTMGTTNAEGYFVTSFLSNQFGNGSMALLLVEGYSGTLGTDLDTNDDGTFETTPWTNIIDSVGVDDGGSDPRYAVLTLLQNYDGISFTVGGASFLPSGDPTGTAADWIRNDFHGAGLPGLDGTLVDGEAANTPGLVNSLTAPPPPPPPAPVISEFVLDHTGSDTMEFVEIFGVAESDYSAFRILIIDGDATGGDPGNIMNVITPGVANNSAVWASQFTSEQFSDGSVTLMIVEGFQGAVDTDLDTDNDGTVDVEVWTASHDAVAVRHNQGDVVYAQVVLEAGFGGGQTAPGGASRYPYYADTDSVNDWLPNDFDGNGFVDFPGSLTDGETINTPGRVNRVGETAYYRGLSTALGQTGLRDAVNALIDDHIYFPYTDGGTDTWDILEDADQDPDNSSQVISIYRNATYTKVGGGNNDYNREHTWPSSYGFTDNIPLAYPYTDAHHLRIANASYNSSRSNTPFGDCSAGCNELPTEFNAGRGGQGGGFPGDSNWSDNGSDIFQVWNARKGDVARSLLYLDVRYNGGQHVVTGGNEPNLILTDNLSLVQTMGSNTTGDAYMGRLSVLLQWHMDDPVDEDERRRNEVVYSYQGNRNPFVDHPEWADCIFNDACGTEPPVCFNPSLPSWTLVDNEVCEATNAVTVLHFVSLLNGDCVCQ